MEDNSTDIETRTASPIIEITPPVEDGNHPSHDDHAITVEVEIPIDEPLSMEINKQEKDKSDSSSSSSDEEVIVAEELQTVECTPLEEVCAGEESQPVDDAPCQQEFVPIVQVDIDDLPTIEVEDSVKETPGAIHTEEIYISEVPVISLTAPLAKEESDEEPTDKPVYRVGETVRLHISSSSSCAEHRKSYEDLTRSFHEDDDLFDNNNLSGYSVVTETEVSELGKLIDEVSKPYSQYIQILNNKNVHSWCKQY